MCTKVPLELQLRKDENESITMEYTNSHDENINKENIPFNSISHEIETATKSIVGDRKTIKDSPIKLRICSPAMKDLTLIDLPGITRASNAPEMADVEHETKSMIGKYVESESKLIVCALPANVDFSNSGALKIAQEVDPEGKRTLGAATKIDTYEKGTGIARRIEGNHETEIKLKLGYVTVRGRTQKELKSGLSLEDLHATEAKLLSTDKVLKFIPKDMKGTPVLINKLIEIQRDRLKEGVPELIEKIDDAIAEREEALELMKNLPESSEECFARLIDIVHSLCAEYKELTSRHSCQEDEFDIRSKMYTALEKYKSEISKASGNVFNQVIYKKVEELCRKQKAVILPNFLAISVFNKVYKTEFLIKYMNPTNKLIEDVHSQTQSMLHLIVDESLKDQLEQAIPPFKRMVDQYYENIKNEVGNMAEKDIEMNMEIFAPLTTSYETHRKRLTKYQADYFRYMEIIRYSKRRHRYSFSSDEEEWLCCNEDEWRWIKEQTQKEDNNGTIQQCLEMMNSIAAYSNCVRDYTLDYMPKKIYWNFLTKPCGKNSDSLFAFLRTKCTENKEGLFLEVHSPELLQKRDRFHNEVKELKKCKEVLNQIGRVFHKH